MRLLSLSLQNIGPFNDVHLEFLSNPGEAPAVALLTGENGTGKSVVLDAIRGMFGSHYCKLERKLWRPGEAFRVELSLQIGDERRKITSTEPNHDQDFATDDPEISNAPQDLVRGGPCPSWVMDFWQSTMAKGTYEIQGLVVQNHRQYLLQSLQGSHRNAQVTELICHFDYLRDSRDPREQQAGEVLYEATKKIVDASLLQGGELSHVARATFTPMVKQSGHVVPLANLSSGNAYLIQRMISLLGKMYAVHVLRGTDPSELCKTPGLLLIDEAENHFHPRWHRALLRKILSIFPNLQIIATTHSPFILSSAPGARVFVCRFDKEKTTCVVDEENDAYENKPVEEILLSGAFDQTPSFNEDISWLLEARKKAAESGDHGERRRIENLLRARNPDYFSYFSVEEQLRALGRGDR